MLTTSDLLTIVGMAFGALIGTAAGIWSLAWWLSGQFSQVRHLLYDKIEEVKEMFTRKLESHEIHDNKRFNSLTNDLWLIRVRNAARDGLPVDKLENPLIET